jgi:Zn-dependent membrane protease YugP
MIFGLDPMYYLFALPALILAFWAQAKVQSAYTKYSRVRAQSGLTGAEAAREVLNVSGLEDVAIEEVPGNLTDHYDPRTRTLNLSSGVFHGRSVAALGVAAHEAGHAVQHAQHYAPLALRSALVPAVGLGSNLAWIIFVLGMFMSPILILVAIGCFTLAVIFALVTLPVEFNASRRALAMLTESGAIYTYEVPQAKAVLHAAALTYVAAVLMAIMTLLYALFRAGLLGRRSED